MMCWLSKLNLRRSIAVCLGVVSCNSPTSVVVLSLMTLASVPARAAIINAPFTSSDHVIGERESGAPAAGYYAIAPAGSGENNKIGESGSGGSRRSSVKVIGFTLPNLGPGNAITAANFGVTNVADGNSPANGEFFNLDLYGLFTTNPDGTGTALYYDSGTVDAINGILLDADFIIDSTPDGSLVTDDVTAFIQSLYVNGAPLQPEVFFRLNADRDISIPGGGLNANDGYFIANPTLTLTTLFEPVVAVPEPASVAAWLLAGIVGCALGWRHRRATWRV